MQFHYTLICYTYNFILHTYYCLSTCNVYLSNVALACLDDIATDDGSKCSMWLKYYLKFNMTNV